MSGLTRDNPLLSRPILEPIEGPFHPGTSGRGRDSEFRAINCSDISDDVRHYVNNSLADNTRRAYASDLKHFSIWGGELPAHPEVVASYLADHADTLAVSTLVRRVASISRAHELEQLPNPVKSELVRRTLKGIKRTKRTAQRQARPLIKDDLYRVLAAMGEDVKAIRDRSLLLVGFAGGFRRSELVAIDRADVETTAQGMVITIRRSKTDQLGVGRKIGVPFGRTKWCPVRSLVAWLAVADINKGAVFRRVDRHGRVCPHRLSGEAVSLVVKQRVAAAYIVPDGFSGHSLRAGFATSAAQAGASELKIRQQTGHASDAMLRRYIRDAELFTDNAASLLL